MNNKKQIVNNNFLADRIEKEQSQLSNEFKLLITLIGPAFNEHTTQSLDTFTKQQLNWNEFIRLINRHRVAPLVWRGLNRHSDFKIPLSIQEKIDQQVSINKKKALLQSNELIKLCRLLNDNGIEPVSLKGPILAKQVYGDIGMRHAGDLDIFIKPAELTKAKTTLLNYGYQLNSKYLSISEKDERLFMKLRNHYQLSHNNSTINIELHWRLLFSDSLNSCLNLAAPETRTIDFFNQTTNILEPEINCIYLVLHGTRHAWFRLKWLCDIAELRYRNPDLLETVYNRYSRSLKLVRPFVQLDWLLQTYFSISLPFIPRVRSKSTQKMILYSSAQIHGKTIPPFSDLAKITREIRYNLLIIKDLRYKIYFLLTKLIVAGDEWKASQMPGWNVKLFRLIYSISRWIVNRRMVKEKSKKL